MKEICTVLILVCLLAACASEAPPEKKTVPVLQPETIKTDTPPAAPKPERTPEPSVRFPSGDGLDLPQFTDLPSEARDYLKILTEAFRTQDKEFLIAQGEGQYEKELRFRYDEETYLAMLYRVGIYSEETHDNPLTLPRLEYTEIKTIEFYEWEEKGPILEIAGLLYLRDGSAFSCGINLVWKLIEPKILGAWPDKGF